jgi:alanine dehydrogenase
VLIGVPREIKDHEFRVGLTPAGVRLLVSDGHAVRVQSRAGERIGFDDAHYATAGASVVATAAEAYDCPLVIKVKEPLAAEFPFLKRRQTLFCYLHLAPDPALTHALLQAEVVGIAYETVSGPRGGLPLLTPMSEVAGRLAVQAGAHALQLANGGNGVLLGGVPGVAPGRVTLLGGGTVGTHAARMALGLGADVTVVDVNLERLRQLDELFGARLKTRYSEPSAIAELAAASDLVIASVLIPGKRAPRLLTRDTVKSMGKGAVLVDVAIDQGGCAETSRPTTHTAPTYVEEGVVHYCVSNMPAAVARTATQALTHATLPCLRRLAQGVRQALESDPGLMAGLNVCLGRITHKGLAEDLGAVWCNPADALLGMD